MRNYTIYFVERSANIWRRHQFENSHHMESTMSQRCRAHIKAESETCGTKKTNSED